MAPSLPSLCFALCWEGGASLGLPSLGALPGPWVLGGFGESGWCGCGEEEALSGLPARLATPKLLWAVSCFVHFCVWDGEEITASTFTVHTGCSSCILHWSRDLLGQGREILEQRGAPGTSALAFCGWPRTALKYTAEISWGRRGIFSFFLFIFFF